MIMDNFDSPFLYNRPSVDVEGVKKAIVYKLIFLIEILACIFYLNRVLVKKEFIFIIELFFYVV